MLPSHTIPIRPVWIRITRWPDRRFRHSFAVREILSEYHKCFYPWICLTIFFDRSPRDLNADMYSFLGCLAGMECGKAIGNVDNFNPCSPFMLDRESVLSTRMRIGDVQDGVRACVTRRFACDTGGYSGSHGSSRRSKHGRFFAVA